MSIVTEKQPTIAERRIAYRAEKRKKARQNLETIKECVYGHLWSRIEDRWANPYRDRHALSFTDSGKARISSIFSWIVAIESVDAQISCILADDIVRQLDNLRDYGGTTNRQHYDGRDFDVSRYRIELSDDGTFNGFSVLWHALVDDDYEGETQDRLIRSSPWSPPCRYAFSFDGGLLYHGPGGGEVYSMSLNSCLWSIHT